MAAPAFGTVGTYLAGFTGTTAAVPVPASVANNDVILVDLYLEVLRTITPPAGFTLLNSAPAATTKQWHYKYWKRATGTDTGTYSFTWTTATYCVGSAMRVTGCITSGSPVDVFDAQINSTFSAVSPAVTVTTTGVDRLLVFSATNYAGGAWTPPTSFTERVDNTAEFTSDTLPQAVAGSSGSVTATCASSDAQTAWLLALLPVSSASALPQRPVMGPSSAVVRASSW